MIELVHIYNDIISIKNLCEAWCEFVRGKKSKKDVAEFSLNLSKYIFDLHCDLKNKTYTHGQYEAFFISDPKPRSIHKAIVRDRLLHHAIYRVLYSYFDRKFIYDSYSCRNLKGVHRAFNRFRDFARKVSKNHSRTCFVLKCDVRKFFASIDQKILIEVVGRHITDPDTLWLIGQVVSSFESTEKDKGLPLGNLTSQLLVNVFMNEFDQYVKHELKAKYYVRYADDFVLLSHDRSELARLLPPIQAFLFKRLKLSLHPDKVFIKTLASGVDFLGWVHFPDHLVVRTATKRRILKRFSEENEALSRVAQTRKCFYTYPVSHQPFKYIDIHSHVNFAAFDADREATIKRALGGGVAMVNVGTQEDTSKKAIELATNNEGVFAIVGLHPVHTGKSFHDEKELGVGGKEFTSRGETFNSTVYRTMAEHPKVVAIGECGLDYYRLEAESEQNQRDVFAKHIALASDVGKPLMLHVRSGSGRSAYRDALAMLKSHANVKGNFHFFSGSSEEAQEILDASFTLSFTGVITFAHDYDEVIKNAPLDRILSETDSPYVAPVPYRGKRNEPLYVREVVKAIARIRNEDEEKVRIQILKNAEKLFNISLT